MIHLYMLCKPSADTERSSVSRLWTYSTLHIPNLGWQLGPNGLFPAVPQLMAYSWLSVKHYWGPVHCLCTPKVRIPLLHLKGAIQGSLHLSMTFKKQDVICGEKGFNSEPTVSSPERKKKIFVLWAHPSVWFWCQYQRSIFETSRYIKRIWDDNLTTTTLSPRVGNLHMNIPQLSIFSSLSPVFLTTLTGGESFKLDGSE